MRTNVKTYLVNSLPTKHSHNCENDDMHKKEKQFTLIKWEKDTSQKSSQSSFLKLGHSRVWRRIFLCSKSYVDRFFPLGVSSNKTDYSVVSTSERKASCIMNQQVETNSEYLCVHVCAYPCKCLCLCWGYLLEKHWWKKFLIGPYKLWPSKYFPQT
jgi:hypothetical protein